MRVLVVTEIRLYRDGVAAALCANDDIAAVTAATGRAAVVAARHHEVEVVLLDLTMADWLGTTRSMLSARPALKIVVLGATDEGPELVQAAEAGVAGYVSRDASLSDLVEAVRCAHRGEAPCPSTVAAGLLRHIALQARARHVVDAPVRLTPRERDVLRLLQSGLSNKEIARALDLQVSTVKNHVHNVLGKYGVHDREEVLQELSVGGG